MKWVIQRNLGQRDVERAKRACRKNKLRYQTVNVVPFSPDLFYSGSIDEQTAFYGATRWISNIQRASRWMPGVWFDPESTYSVWMKHYGGYLLNYDAHLTTLQEMYHQPYPDNRRFFVRPVEDNDFDASVNRSGLTLRQGKGRNRDEIVFWRDGEILDLVFVSPDSLRQVVFQPDTEKIGWQPLG